MKGVLTLIGIQTTTWRGLVLEEAHASRRDKRPRPTPRLLVAQRAAVVQRVDQRYVYVVSVIVDVVLEWAKRVRSAQVNGQQQNGRDGDKMRRHWSSFIHL